VAAFALLYEQLPWWIDGERLRRLAADQQSGVLSSDRGDVLKMVAGAGALIALIYTARKHALDRQVYVLSKQGQVTDRYTKAIALLASEKLEERIGGIYALERIMADSVRDHPTVVEVLAAFVREHAPRTPPPLPSEAEPATDPPKPSRRPTADVQAAMTVLARRPEREESFAVDLRHADLAGIELPVDARLSGANLTDTDLCSALIAGADLSGAQLHKADLTGARLHRAKMIGARLAEATLRGAQLGEANLSGARLFRADLTGAMLDASDLTRTQLEKANLAWALLSGADLTGAQLDGASLHGSRLVGANLTGARFIDTDLTAARLVGTDLTGACDLQAAQLAESTLSENTKLDAILARDAWVKARLMDCLAQPLHFGTPPPTPDPTASNAPDPVFTA